MIQNKLKSENFFNRCGDMPDTPGVYLMKNSQGGILYVGKAGNLKRRVSSYFNRPHEFRIQKMVSEIRNIEIRNTDTAIEALILESALIKKYQPPFNVLEKDDKSFLYVEITKDKFPRVLLVRGKERTGGREFGPFTSATSIREALKILRKIFPWSIHGRSEISEFHPNITNKKNVNLHSGHSDVFVNSNRLRRACFEYEIGLCPGTCIGAINAKDYKANIKKLILFFEGKKGQLLKSLEKEMKAASKKTEYEQAGSLRRQIFALKHIRDVALITEDKFNEEDKAQPRIEGYDISNISGESAVGSMVVFVGNEPDKNEYRKFRIRYSAEPNPARRSSDLRSGGGDTGMLKEVLRRRFGNSWTLPNLILIDGGAGQVNAAKSVLEEYGLRIPVIGMVKGVKRKRTDVIGFAPKGIAKNTLIQVRDEAHRFAITYHKKVRSRAFFG